MLEVRTVGTLGWGWPTVKERVFVGYTGLGNVLFLYLGINDIYLNFTIQNLLAHTHMIGILQQRHNSISPNMLHIQLRQRLQENTDKKII